MKIFELLRENIILVHNDMKEFSSFTGIHNFDSKEHPFVQFIWKSVFFLHCLVTIVIIYSVYDDILTRPKITGIALHSHGHSLDFPAVILCPVEPFNVAFLKKLNEYSRGLNLTEFTLEELAECTTIIVKFYSNISVMDEKCQRVSVFTKRFINPPDVAHRPLNPEDFFRNCYFKGERISCQESFFLFHTSRGYCFSFNQDFSKNRRTFPIVTNESAQITEFDKDWSLKFDFLKLDSSVRIYLMSPKDFMTISARPTVIWKQKKLIGIRFDIMQNSCGSNIRELTLKQRKCLFRYEPSLNPSFNQLFTKTFYNQGFCFHFCHALMFDRNCNCNPIYYRQLFADLSNRSCETIDLPCVVKTIPEVQNAPCDWCPANCEYDDYILEEMLTKRNIQEYYGKDTDFEGLVYKPFFIELDSWPVIKYHTSVLFGQIDLMVAFGGIASLFLGFSFLNLVDCLFHLTLKFWISLYHNREKLEKMIEHRRLKQPPKIRMDLKISRKRNL